MLKKIQIHFSSLETLLHTKDHLSQLTLIKGGSKYNVMVEWESGEVTYEPLTLISKDDPITCVVYAKKHDLLDTTGWKHLKRYAKTSKRLIRAVKQSRIRQVRASARYQHGFQVPKDYNDAIRLDKENSNTHWQDAMDLELTQIHEYKVFNDTIPQWKSSHT